MIQAFVDRFISSKEAVKLDLAENEPSSYDDWDDSLNKVDEYWTLMLHMVQGIKEI